MNMKKKRHKKQEKIIVSENYIGQCLLKATLDKTRVVYFFVL